ncbi:hypothetical protein EUA03_15080, partial [Mycolicibacterium mucogenicum]
MSSPCGQACCWRRGAALLRPRAVLQPSEPPFHSPICGSPEIVEGSLCRFRRDVGFPDLVV